MIENRQLASRYAEPVVQLAQEQNQLSRIKEEAELILKTAEDSRDLRLLLKSPVVKNNKKLAVLEEVFKGKLSPLMQNLVKVVSRNSREPQLLDIVRLVVSRYNDLHNIGEGTLEVATELDKATYDAISTKVAGILGKDRMDFQVEVKPDLIGGFKVKLGDRQIDASVKGQLQDLRNTFLR
jgi:F-type H+-transporting ATPase subunit delta